MKYSEALECQLWYARNLAAVGRRQPHPDVAEWHQGMERLAAVAETFYWCKEVIPLLDKGASSIKGYVLNRESLPSRAGFCWFEIPVSLFGDNVAGFRPDGKEIVIHGLMWIGDQRPIIAPLVWGADPHYPELPPLPGLGLFWEYGRSSDGIPEVAKQQTDNPL